MDGPLLAQARLPRRRHARAVAPLQWLIKHPLNTAVLYLVTGGAIMCLLLNSSSRQQSRQDGHRISEPPHKQQEQPAVLPTTAPGAGPTVNRSTALPTSAAPVSATQTAVCTDACFKAKDGTCDDGRLAANISKGLATTVLCDLGTDCSDCGVWTGVQNSSSWTEPMGPVAYLRQANLSILTKQTVWELKFHVAYTQSNREGDPSRLFHETGVVEPGVTHIAYHVLREACKKQGEGLLVDVGAGIGWYSILAGVLGCRVVAFEPVTVLRAFMEYSIARNMLQDKVQLRPTVAVQYPSAVGNRNYTVAVPQQELLDASRTDGLAAKHRSGKAMQKEAVCGEKLDQVWQAEQLKHVALLRVDAKGHEADVMAGAAQLLQKQLINNILMGYSYSHSPQMLGQHARRTADPGRAPKMLLSLLSAGFRIGHVQEKGSGDLPLKSFAEPLETLAAVTEVNLQFDLSDSMQMTKTGTGWLKEPCKEMLDLQLIGDKVPERLHPKSFRSSFDAGTNIWASREARFLPYLQGPAVGAFPAERKITDSWFIPEWSDAAMGGRSCRQLQKLAAQENMTAAARAAHLVRHRCRCGRTQPCETEERIADDCAQHGKTPFAEEPILASKSKD